MITKTIADILGGRCLHCVDPKTSLRDVARLMAQQNVGAVVVLEDSGLAGILTERDIVFRGIGQDLSVDEATAAEIMTVDPVTVDVRDAITDALAAKLGDAFRHLPVLDGETVVGILSYRDIPAEYMMMFERFREMSSAHADGGV